MEAVAGSDAITHRVSSDDHTFDLERLVELGHVVARVVSDYYRLESSPDVSLRIEIVPIGHQLAQSAQACVRFYLD